MNNKEKYDQAFIESFSVEADALNENLTYQSIAEWDSVGHMGLIAALEDAFDIMMDTEDIIEFGSYTIGIDIMKKYKVEI
ncbi:MAG: acyl carrier protein [Methylocystaceae bacterium]|nr:acyl carrier protein [Methylocystaceae bacterium]